MISHVHPAPARPLPRWPLILCAALLLFAPVSLGQTPVDAGAACGGASACPEDLSLPTASALAQQAPRDAPMLVFFWGVGCPHCEEARPFVDAIAAQGGVRVERVEVRGDPAGRARFVATMRRLGVSAAGIPAFVVGGEWEIGYSPGVTEARVQAMLRRARSGAGAPRTIEVPLLGRIEPATVSLPALTLSMGLVDGLNPCAMWVLLVLMGILLQTRDTRRMLLYASVFVTMSGVVYFGFMTAWSALFSLVGLSSVATRALGVVLLVMGAINLKELVWFKRGVSLMIPDAAKPSLYRRMRGIVGAASAPAALGGVAALAFVVNLVELGCTLGLPAVYTRILSLRDLPVGERLAWIGLYNIAYVVPLTGVVLVVVTLRRKVSLGEGAARALKFVSGVALAGFGVLFLVAPEVMSSR